MRIQRFILEFLLHLRLPFQFMLAPIYLLGAFMSGHRPGGSWILPLLAVHAGRAGSVMTLSADSFDLVIAGACPAGASRLRFEAGSNPCRGVATLRVTLADTREVTVRIVDASGRRVRSFDPGRLQAGSHEIIWNTRDRAGDEVASGVYFAVARAGETTLRRTLLVLR